MEVFQMPENLTEPMVMGCSCEECLLSDRWIFAFNGTAQGLIMLDIGELEEIDRDGDLIESILLDRKPRYHA